MALEFRRFETAVYIAALATGLLALITPELWVSALVKSELVTAAVERWPKLKSDADAIARYSEPLSLRYQVSYLVSAIVFPALGFIAAHNVYRKGFITRPWPAFVSRSNLFIIPGLLLFIMYIVVFDQTMAWSNARSARSIFQTFICVWWPPLLLGAAAVGIHRLAMNVVAITRGL